MCDRRTLLIGSRNPSKILRWGTVFRDYNVLDPASLGLALDVAEGEPTVLANALNKAIAYARASGSVTLSEDAGLRLLALGDFPGVELRTWGGAYESRLDDESLTRRLKEALRSANDTRGAFDLGVAVAAPDGFVRTATHESIGHFQLDMLDASLETGNPLSSAFISDETGRPWAEMVELSQRPPSSRRFAERVRSIADEVFEHVECSPFKD